LHAEEKLNVGHLKRILLAAPAGKTALKVELKLANDTLVSIRNIKSCQMDQALRAQLLTVHGVIKMSG